MRAHTPLQLQALRRMGVEVWRLRAGDGGVSHAETESVSHAETGEVSHAKTDGVSHAATDGVSHAETESVSHAETESVSHAKTNAPDSPAQNLTRIGAEISACEKCALHKTRTHAVPGVGNARAEWLFIGEAPGRNEDLQGAPFVGRAGKLLDAMLAALGMPRAQVFIANVLKCRPPENRDPLPPEIEQCEPYLHRQLEEIRPKIIVALGRISAQSLLKTEEPLSKLRGRVHHYGARNIPLVVTYHPAYLLRSPEQKSKAWEDLWLARATAAGS